MNKGHCVVRDPGLILAYDDFVLQLDESIYKTLGTVKASIAAVAAGCVQSRSGRLFFHCNYPARARSDLIMRLHDEALSVLLKEEHEDIHEINIRAHKDRIPILANPDGLLKANVSLGAIIPGGKNDSWREFAKAFKYPGRFYEREDGSRVWTTIPEPGADA